VILGDLRDGGDQYSSFEPTTLIAGKPNQAFTASLRIENVSPSDPGWVYVDFYASTDRSITSADAYLGRTKVWIIHNVPATATLNTILPASLPPGTYYVGWIIDPNNSVPDTDKSNNVAYKSTPLLRVVNSSQSIVYVDAGAHGANDGSTWKNAFTSLQDALAMAVSGREIRVARGLYTPDQGLGITRGSREAGFTLISGITVSGGYAGVSAPDPNARNVQAYATVLSGDLRANDLPVADPCNLWKEASRTDNSRHVLTLMGKDLTTILDGVQVTGGYAFGPTATASVSGDLQGAGLIMLGGSLTVRNCTFSGNWASGDGGALYVANGRLELTDCTFRANGAGTHVGQSRGTGGAIRSDGSSQMTLARCKFQSNFAGVQGGAFDNDKGSAVLTWCSFLRNSAGSAGGGALWNSEGRVNLAGCILNGNRSDQSGGAITNGWTGTLSAANCCLYANHSKVQAGAIDNTSGGKTALWNCTLAANRQDGSPGAIVCGPALGQAVSELTIANCILWDGAGEISNQGKAVVTIARTDIQGGWTAGNFSSDPLFVSPAGLDGVAGTEDDNLRLASGSPCIDRGDNTLLPQDFADVDGDGNVKESVPLDLDGRERTAGTAVDIGAYEVQPSSSSSCSSG